MDLCGDEADEDVAGVDVHDDERLQRDAVLLRQLSAHQLDDVVDLPVVDVEEVLEVGLAPGDGRVDECRPHLLRHAQHRLPRPFAHPLDPRLVQVRNLRLANHLKSPISIITTQRICGQTEIKLFLFLRYKIFPLVCSLLIDDKKTKKHGLANHLKSGIIQRICGQTEIRTNLFL